MAEKQNNNTAIIVLSILVGVFFLLWIGTLIYVYQNDAEWYNNYNQNHIEWCEFGNDNAVMINLLLDQLEIYDLEYSEVERIPKLDCYE